jgi:hypothetical protein
MHSSDSGTLFTAAPVKLVQSIEEATRKLTRTEQKSSKNQTFKVVPPPFGQPLFVFFHIFDIMAAPMPAFRKEYLGVS